MITYSVPDIKYASQPAKHKKAVAFCVDKTYLPYAAFVASKLIKLESHTEYDIVICLPKKDYIPSSLPGPIRYCVVDFRELRKLPTGRLTTATYHKIFLPVIFQKEYDQILYLDADVYIKNISVNSIMNDNKHKKGLCMAVDISEIECKSGVNSHNSYLYRYNKQNHLYRNAGVILFNSSRLLKINYLDLLMDYAYKNKKKLVKHDQTLINSVLYKEIDSLSFRDNFQLIDVTIPLIDEFKPNIIHFVGELKPWNTNTGYIGTYFSEYSNFVQSHFPSQKLHPLSEFEIKFACRKKQKKYKNIFREQLSLAAFRARKFFSKVSVINKLHEVDVKKRMNKKLPQFRTSLKSEIYSSDL